jgi:hypothetical protein
MKDHKFVGYMGQKEGMRKTRERKFNYFWFEINNTGCNTMKVGKSLEQIAGAGQGQRCDYLE